MTPVPVKCLNVQIWLNIINIINICYLKYQSIHLGCHSPCRCGFLGHLRFFCFFSLLSKVLVSGKTSSHPDCDWIGCYMIFFVDVTKLVCDDVGLEDECWCCRLMKTGFWLLVLDTGYRIQDDLVDISDVDDNECGRFSISSWLVWCPTP